MRLGILAADTWIRTLSAHVCKTHVQNTFGAKDSYCRAHSKYTSIVTCCRQHSFAKVYAHFSSDALPISNIMKLNFLHTRMLRNSHPNQCNWFLLDSEEKSCSRQCAHARTCRVFLHECAISTRRHKCAISTRGVLKEEAP